MTKQFSNYSDLLTFTRASAGHALRPVSYGDELVTNGTFDTDTTGWTAGSGGVLSVASGQLSVTCLDGDNLGLANQAITTEIGKIYQVTATRISQDESSPWGIATTTASARDVVDFGDAVTGTINETFVATATTLYIQLWSRSASQVGDKVAVYDNVSVKEVTFDQPDGTLTLFEHPEGVPRVEYDADGVRLGLLVEESRTNEINYSQDFDNADWTKTRCTITANQALAPDGTQTADLMTATGNDARLQDDISNSTDFVTQSVWVKSATGGDVAGQLDFAGLDTQTFTASGEWQRIHTTSTNLSFSDLIRIRITNSGDSLYVWGAQLEKGAFPTSYIKSNSGSTTTRSADVAEMNVADFGFNPDGMTVLIEGSSFSTGTGALHALLSISDGTTNNRISVRVGYAQSWHTSGTNNGKLDYTNVGSTTSKVIYTIDSASQAATIDGATVLEDSSVTVPTGLSELYIGSRYEGGNYYLNGHIKSIKYYPRRLTNAQLQDLTS